jgi:hypothetical protein
MRRRETHLIVLGVFIVILQSSTAETSAIPEYSKDLPQSLKNNCNVCHEKASGGPINDFGRDYASFNHVIEAVKGLDSDGDGYENGDELEAGTFPGFASSYPNNPKKGLDIRIILAVLSVLVGALVVSKKALNKR